MTPAASPDLSVVIASYNARATISECLESLQRQRTSRPFEIILVDSGTDGTGSLVEQRFPEVRLLRSRTRRYCGDARNIGISEAKGDIVAFLDADCTAHEDWVDRVLRAHASHHGAVGGSILNSEPCNAVGWAAYFLEFSEWMPATPRGTKEDVAGANMSYDIGLLKQTGPFIEGTYCSDTEFHWRMVAGGDFIRFDPSIRVTHRGIDTWPIYLRHEFFHGSCFARVRSRRLGRGLRTLHALGLPLLPAVLLFRIASRNVRNPVYLGNFIRSLPALVPGLMSWSLGESFGYLSKEGRRGSRSRPRPRRAEQSKTRRGPWLHARSEQAGPRRSRSDPAEP